MWYFICVSSSKCWIYRYWSRLCIRYIFCLILEWAEIYIRMWRIWAVEIQRWMKAAENSCRVQLLFGAGACSRIPLGEQNASGLSRRWRLIPLLPAAWSLISSLGEGLVPSLLAGGASRACPVAQADVLCGTGPAVASQESCLGSWTLPGQ